MTDAPINAAATGAVFIPDRFTDLRERFAYAWADLGERINAAVSLLDELADAARQVEQVIPGTNAQRLTDKASGLRAAQELYAALDPDGEAADRAGAWRTFEGALGVLVRAQPDGPFRQGMSLASGYQRGYGIDDDAAPLVGRSR